MSNINPDIITKTQKYLGKYVKKPALTEKLLSKPPFRFLHDIIKVVIKEHGFLKGLFNNDELIYENIKDKEAKIAFLTKLIDAVKYISKTELKTRPSKIVAGLEPVETNLLLQTIGKCIDKKIDTSEYVSKVSSGEIIKEKPAKKVGHKEKDKKADVKETSKEKRRVREASVSRTKKSGGGETPKSTDRIKESTRTKSKDNKTLKPKQKKEEVKKDSPKPEEDKKKDSPRLGETKNEPVVELPQNEEATGIQLEEEAPPTTSKNNPTDEESQKPEEQPVFSNARLGSASLTRPKSARPKSGDRLLSAKPKPEPDSGPVEMKPLGSAALKRPPSSLRPPSVRPSSARPGAPRLRPDSALPLNEPVAMGNIKVIVENAVDEEETVVIQNAPDEEDENELTPADLLNNSSENKGQLVEQILEQIQEEGSKRRVEIDWEQDGLRGKDATTREVTQLRSLIQSLTRTANPLGKLLNYLHEDLDAMHNELQTWTNTKKQLYAEIEKQKKLTMESSKPLAEKLEHLRQEIRKQEKEIVVVRGNILKNERRIADLLGNK
ncbi:hypothetical protein GWI33_006516 [Rhynchophorus ferrugineus]|uniref:TRAF3-interacting protein 1 n=1 Tax=Rhynchophorus ferrugineus TaxID=354439 RepID=A0A834ILP1_RHYFE|nr:hypothetical protein GWI33_006516 [Rhynchophorus ferrugineus]